MYLGMLLTFMFMNIFRKYVYLQERKRSEIIRSLFCIYKSRWKLTLGARDFSSAVSGFCQVFIVTRAKIKPLFFFTKFCDILSFHYPGYQRFFSRLRRSWLRPTAENVSAFGQHRNFPPHARKTSGTQGSGS